MHRRGVASLVILIGIALAALLAGVQVAQTYKPNHPGSAEALANAGGTVGFALAGKPGEAIGQNAGYLVALALAMVAAQRHGAAAAAQALLKHTATTPTKPPSA